MLQQIAFIPQHQFHVLISFPGGDEHAVTVLPNEAGKFRVVDQGEIIAEVNIKKDLCICYRGKLTANIIAQLEYQIKDHYA